MGLPGSDSSLRNHSNLLGQGAGRAFTESISALPLPGVIPHPNPGQIIHLKGKLLSIPTTNSLLRAKLNPLSAPALGISLPVTAGEAISWFCCLLHTPLTTPSNFTTSTKKLELVKDPAVLKIKKENIKNHKNKSRENPCPYTGEQSRGGGSRHQSRSVPWEGARAEPGM